MIVVSLCLCVVCVCVCVHVMFVTVYVPCTLYMIMKRLDHAVVESCGVGVWFDCWVCNCTVHELWCGHEVCKTGDVLCKLCVCCGMHVYTFMHVHLLFVEVQQ